ncbi:type IV pilin protein [Pseudomonas sp. NPDC087358]|uniref:type IV pilin protein n=1 Tax=Pseudomonas sp. NPDC087358 TaxID=3364439 RepID=UPI003850B71B
MNRGRMSARANGFTLLELLIAVAIVAILAAMSYPSYTEYIRKTHRSEITALLVQEAHRLERFYSRAGQYSNTTTPPAREHQVSTGNGFYTVTADRAEQAFMLMAMPLGGTLMSEDKCGSFVLEHSGRRDNLGVSGDASGQGCWGR